MQFEAGQRQRLKELLAQNAPSRLKISHNLTFSEHSFLQMVALGFRAKEMARHGHTIRAVKQALYRARVKLGARTTTHAVYLATKDGIIR